MVLVIGTKVSICTRGKSVYLSACHSNTKCHSNAVTLLTTAIGCVAYPSVIYANELDKPITYAEVNKTSSKICGGIWIFMSCSLNAIGFIGMTTSSRGSWRRNERNVTSREKRNGFMPDNISEDAIFIIKHERYVYVCDFKYILFVFRNIYLWVFLCVCVCVCVCVQWNCLFCFTIAVLTP